MRVLLALALVALYASSVAATAPLDCANAHIEEYSYDTIGTWDVTLHGADNNDSCVCLEWEDPPNPVTPCDEWKFVTDSFEDGTDGCTVGADSIYEVYGMAVHNTDSYQYVFINTNMPISGTIRNNRALDNTIDPGDLLMHYTNFGSGTLNAANSDDLWAVHFTPDSDSTIQIPGLFKDVQTESVTRENAGYSTFGRYYDYFNTWTGKCTYGNEFGLGDAPASYFDRSKGTPTSIKSGNRVGTGCANIAYMVFSDQESRNNPTFLNYLNNQAGTSQALCGFQQGVMCDCIDALADSAISEYLARKPSDWTGDYDYGIRINKSALDRAQEPVRITFSVECSNDIVAVDFTPTC
jgi:hypothetical protein